MWKFKKKDRAGNEPKSKGTAMSSADFAIYNTISGSQRSSYSDRGEMCTGTLNNNQKLATLQMMRDWRD